MDDENNVDYRITLGMWDYNVHCSWVTKTTLTTGSRWICGIATYTVHGWRKQRWLPDHVGYGGLQRKLFVNDKNKVDYRIVNDENKVDYRIVNDEHKVDYRIELDMKRRPTYNSKRRHPLSIPRTHLPPPDNVCLLSMFIDASLIYLFYNKIIKNISSMGRRERRQMELQDILWGYIRVRDCFPQQTYIYP